MDGKQYPFEFSVVMAVYNVEPFLREAVDSLIAQDFGFENIQLIMVDDGSTDGSGAICDEYARQFPENVVVIHKENGGVASARNEGLKYATGRFLNFMDSDDKFTENAFQQVYNFFIENEEFTDVVTTPLYFFDATEGEHWQNGKFKKGTRLLDLFWDYQATIMFVNASFFTARVKDGIVFDSHLVCGEDMKVLLSVLADKMKMGVVTGCQYLYRRRSLGEMSLIQSAKKKHGWYFDYFTYLVDWAVEFYRARFGFLPAFLQYELLCDLQWRFREIYDAGDVLKEEEVVRYKERLFQTLRYFDDKYIMEQKMLWHEHKCYMLSRKYGCMPEMTSRQNNVLVHFGSTNINSVADHYSKLEFLGIRNGVLALEGFTKIFGVTLEEPLQVFLDVNEELVPCQIVEREALNEYRFGDLIFRGIGFRCELPLNQTCETYKIRIVLRYRNIDIVKRKIQFGNFFPLSGTYQNAYFFAEDWMVQMEGSALRIRRCGRKGHLERELAFCKELWKKNKLGARKAVFVRLLTHLARLVKRKEIWLISDRVNKADDNGEALFRYLLAEHPRERRYYFAISKDSPDCHRLKKVGKVIPFLGWRYKLLALRADFIISSQGEDYIFRPFQGYSDPYRDLQQDYKFIFLQHGVTKDDLSGWMNRYTKNLRGFVTVTRPEYHSIIDGNYFYSEREVWLTGFPRYDRLYHDEKKYITLMPTWRAALMSGMDARTGARNPKSGFTDSSYFRMYTELFQCRRLFDAAERLGYQIRLMNHPNMISTQEFFSTDPRLQRVAFDESYREIFAQSDMVITDYSSVAFDFAYLRKPVLYYQMDEEEFYQGQVYEKGYFDYDQDGFGEVARDSDTLVDRIIEYMESGCKLKDKYRQRIDKFFAFNDQKNCERVYEKIMELEDR